MEYKTREILEDAILQIRQYPSSYTGEEREKLEAKLKGIFGVQRIPDISERRVRTHLCTVLEENLGYSPKSQIEPSGMSEAHSVLTRVGCYELLDITGKNELRKDILEVTGAKSIPSMDIPAIRTLVRNTFTKYIASHS
ncbi:MAG: hypothetical protein WC852_04725 [Candidatus Nanoarchaeia archaeon]|jgi:hypothetical protein